MKTYTIPLENMAQFLNKIDKLAKRAEKLGLQGPEVEECGSEVVKIANDIGFDNYVEMVTINIDFGEEIIIKGWQFLCAIEHLPQGNIVKGYANVDTKWRTAEPNCEHCNTNRQRNNTYVLVNEKGKVIQVGSTCLKDFTGHKDAEAIAEYAAHLHEFIGSEVEEEYDPDKSYSSHLLKIKDYLSYVAMSARNNGYVSRRKSEELGLAVISTADDAMLEMCSKSKNKPTEEDCLLADKVVDFVKNLDAKNDFEHNLTVIFSTPYMNDRHAGYVAGAMGAYIRNLEMKTKNAGSEYVGEVKERKVFTLTVKAVKPIDGFYGVTYLYKFADENGNTFVWFSSKEQGFEIDSTYTVKATIKEHKEYNGEKQTYITRGKVQ